ncbi:MAG: response regulator [Thermoguttaceae bacterium]
MMTAPKRTTRLLLVDDDPSIVRLLTTVIERSFQDQIELKSLTRAKDARSWIEQEVVDILITDLEMPDVNGLELLRCAKRRNACTQVLFITGHSTLDALSDALELGATDYLLKPLDTGEVVELVEHALSRQRRWTAALARTFATQREIATATTA